MPWLGTLLGAALHQGLGFEELGLASGAIREHRRTCFSRLKRLFTEGLWATVSRCSGRCIGFCVGQRVAVLGGHVVAL